MKRTLLALVALVVVAVIVAVLLHEPPEAPGSAGEASAAKPAEAAAPAEFDAAPVAQPAPRALDAARTGCRIRVVDARGAALAGVHVTLFWTDPQAADAWVIGATDAEGRVFLACPAGPCTANANLEPDLETCGAAWQELVVEPDSVAEFDLVLPDATARLTAFVHDEKGAGVAGVTLHADGGVGATKASERARQTDATGLVTWERLIASTWYVSIKSAPDLVTVPQHFKQVVELDAAQGHSLDILLPSKARLIVDLSDSALAAQLVEIDVPNASPSRRGWPFKEPVASWLVSAGDWTVATQWKEDCTRWAAPQTVTLAAGETRSIKLELVEGVASLSGRVIDRRGVPVTLAGIHVRVLRPPSAPGESTASRLLTEKTARTDANGAWRLAGLPAGEAWLNLELRASKQRFLADDMAPSRPFDLAPGHRELPDFLVDAGIALRVRLPEDWLAKATANEVNVEAAFGPDAASGNARRRRLTRKDGAFVFDHGAIDAYFLRIVDKQGKTLATATCSVDPSTAEGATVDVTPSFTSP